MLTERLPYTFNILDYSYLIKAALLGLRGVALHLESEPKKKQTQGESLRKLSLGTNHTPLQSSLVSVVTVMIPQLSD